MNSYPDICSQCCLVLIRTALVPVSGHIGHTLAVCVQYSGAFRGGFKFFPD